jgi:DNA repair protein RadC
VVGICRGSTRFPRPFAQLLPVRFGMRRAARTAGCCHVAYSNRSDCRGGLWDSPTKRQYQMASNVGGLAVGHRTDLGGRHGRQAMAAGGDGATAHHGNSTPSAGVGRFDRAARVHDRHLHERVSDPSRVSLRDLLAPSTHRQDEALRLLTRILRYAVGDAAPETAKALLVDATTLPRAMLMPDYKARTMPGGEKVADFLSLLVEAFEHAVEVGLRAPDVRPDAEFVRFYLTHRLNHERVEVLYGLFFSSSGALINECELARGTESACSASPQEIARRALTLGAAAVVLAHNHPSGSPQPSSHDIRFSSEVASSLVLADATLVDHLIVANGTTASMRKLKMLPQIGQKGEI